MTTLEATLRNNWQLINNWGDPQDKPDFFKVLVPTDAESTQSIISSALPYVYSVTRPLGDVNSYLLSDISTALVEAETFCQDNFAAGDGNAVFLEKIDTNIFFNSSTGYAHYSLIVRLRIMTGYTL